MKKTELVILCFVVLFFMARPIRAMETKLFGEPLYLSGYINQMIGYSLRGDHYDTEKDIQSLLTNLFMEGKYVPHKNWQFLISTRLTADWNYQLKGDDRSWNDKLFDQSRGHLNFDDKYWQVLNEAHVTWSEGKTMIRVGKQVVSWGQTDGFRLMDQINPVDQRRGFSDVKFENSIIPIWLVRAEHFESVSSKWLQEIGLQLVFNPNVTFIPNQALLHEIGNDVGGIYGPFVRIPGPYPFGEAYVGSPLWDIEHPDSFNHKGFEYGAKIEALLWDALVTLNGFYGRNNDPVYQTVGAPFVDVASDGRLLLHLPWKGYYPRFSFLGATFTKEVPFLRVPLGGSPEPVVRLEAFYTFNNSLNTEINTIEKHDEFRAAIGVDWKVKINFLNPRAAFMIAPQLYYRGIFNYPAGPYPYKLADFDNTTLDKNNYMVTLFVTTSYLNQRLSPSAFWMRNMNSRGNFYKFNLAYNYTNNWAFNIGLLLFNGRVDNEAFKVFQNKNQIFFKAEYRWS